MTWWQDEFIHPPWDHQLEEFEQHRNDVARAMHWQMRTGKTKEIIDQACYHYAEGNIDGVLIFAPNNVHSNWVRREINAHHWLMPYRSMAWDSYASKKAEWDVMFNDMLRVDGLAWYAVNVEATVMERQQEYLAAFMKHRPNFLLVVDETHEWRRAGSKRSQFARKVIVPRAKYRRNLSGTMIDNNPLHAFAQYELLGKQQLGFKTYKAFESRFAEIEKQTIYTAGGRQRTIPKVVGFRNQDELRELMAEHTSYVYRDQCDDMPDLVPGELRFDMLPEQKRVYNDLVKGILLTLENGEEVDTNPETGVIAKQQMIRTGFIRDDYGDVSWIIPPEESPAIKAVVDLVKNSDEKVVIWCKLVNEIEALKKAFNTAGIKAVDYYGKTPKKRRDHHEDQFRDDPSVRAMIAQPKACGQGLDFSSGSHIVWFSHLHGDLIAKKQADERCTKKGGRRVAVTTMVGNGTADEKILLDQQAKVEIADFLTGEGLREYLRLI